MRFFIIKDEIVKLILRFKEYREVFGLMLGSLRMFYGRYGGLGLGFKFSIVIWISSYFSNLCFSVIYKIRGVNIYIYILIN